MARGRSDGTVYVDTLIDTKGFGTGINTMKKQMGGLTSAIGKLGLAIAATFGVTKLVQFGKSAIDLASDLEEVQNVVDVTFSTMSDKVNEFAEGAAEAAGLSETMAKRYMGTFGAMSKSFGFIESQAYEMSESLTKMVGDVASFYNLTQDEAYTKLKSVFTGETESLKDLGVVMTQSALDAYAMAEGFGKTTAEMTEQEKVSLRYSFVMSKLSAAQGDFIRTSDGWANQMRILSLSFDTFKSNVGQALINIFTPFLKVINQLVDRMVELSKSFVAFSELLVGKATSGGGGSPGDTLEEIENGYDNVADAADKATDAQKQYLTGLDEISTFSSKENSQQSDILGGELITNPDDMIATEGTVGKAMSGFVEKLAEAFKNEDWESIGGYLSDGIVSALNNLSDKLKKVDWTRIGNKIGEFIKGIKWSEVLKGMGSIIVSAIEGALKLWTGLFDAAPLETAIIAAIAAFKFSGIGSTIAGKISTALNDWLATNNLSVGTISVAATIGIVGITWVINELPDLSIDFGQWFTKQMTGQEITDEQYKEMLKGTGMLPEDFGYVLENWWKTGSIITPEMAELFKKGFAQYISDPISETWEKIKNGVSQGWTKIINVIKGKLNSFISVINNMLSGITSGFNGLIDVLNSFKIDVPDWAKDWTGFGSIGFNIDKITAPKIPYLATGAVIPPNAPFLAMLGDQKHGTNIEAPLDTIKQAVREVVGNSGGQYQFTAQINRRTLFEEMIDEARLRQTTTGRNPFELA